MKFTMLILGICFVCVQCTSKTDAPGNVEADSTKRILKSVPVEHVIPSPSQQQRRQRSEAYCAAKQIPVYPNPNALFVDDDASVEVRTKDEVVNRSLALSYYMLTVTGYGKASQERLRETFGATRYLTPNEEYLVGVHEPTPRQRSEADWSYESLHVLLWALGYVDSLRYPSAMCPGEENLDYMLKRDDTTFRNQARMRSKSEILDQADLILRLHWACREAEFNGKDVPGGLNPDVVMERHRALNWLIRYLERDWDDVTTDT